MERYASCPFRFFLERVLKIEPVEDLALEFDVLNRGRVVHDVLATFHRRVNERLGRPASPLELDAAEFDALLAAAIADVAAAGAGKPASRPRSAKSTGGWSSSGCRNTARSWRSTRRCGRISTLPMTPELFEVSFGRDGEPPPSTAQTLDFVRDAANGADFRAGSTASTRAWWPDKTVFNVLDYKTGGPIKLTPESIRAGTTLQLPLYALAAVGTAAWPPATSFLGRPAIGTCARAASGRDKHCACIATTTAASNWSPSGRNFAPAWATPSSRWFGRFAGGQFPVCSADERCTGRCPFNTICRINQVRSLEKTWQPTATE